MIKKYKILALGMSICPIALATPIQDYQFKSPSFNGNGYGTYVLTIQNEEYTRAQAIQQALQQAAQQQAANAANQPINQFLTNLESRIYAQISQNLATAMFSGGSATSGSRSLIKLLNSVMTLQADSQVKWINITACGSSVAMR